MKYSQNNEDQIIVNYFNNAKNLNILDIGANDGITLSNSYKVINELNWNACLIEPSPTAFKKLFKLYNDNPDIFLFNYALSNKSGEFTFYDSGTHLNNNDTSLLSTLHKSELDRWTKETFKEIIVKCKTINSFILESPIKTFDVISIDVEGEDYNVLTQLNLTELNCKMLIVEFNGKDKQKYIDYCSKFNMKLFTENNENLIFIK